MVTKTEMITPFHNKNEKFVAIIQGMNNLLGQA